MFIVVYSFTVKSGQNQAFKNAWREMTEVIYDYAGSLGSRLHHELENNYIAYAQWPDRETWETASDKLPIETENIGKLMRESCHKIQVLHKLEVVNDLLRDSTKNIHN